MFLRGENNLLVHVVPHQYMGGDEVLTYIAVQANYDMTGKDLLNKCKEMWSLNEEHKNYKLVAVKESGGVTIDENKTLREAGIKHNSPLQIREA